MRKHPLVWWIALAAVPAGVGAVVLGLQSTHPQIRVVGAPESMFFVAIIGWSFITAGLVAWVRRNSGFGSLMVAAGFAWFAAELTASNESLPFSIGLLVSSVWIAIFFHALMSFPGGRPVTRPAVSLVILLYGLFTVVQLAWLLFADSSGFLGCPSCPRNVLQVANDPDLAMTILLIQQPIVAVASVVGGAVVMGRRWWRASPHLRRSLTPVYASGIGCLVIVASVMAVELFSPAVTPIISWLSGAAFSVVPVAFLFGAVRQRLDRSAVGDLIVQLTGPEQPADLRAIIAHALGDPTLQLAYCCWPLSVSAGAELPAGGYYADREGHRVELPLEDSQRAVTNVKHGGKKIAALIHDPSLLDEGDLVRGVCAAAALSLVNERLQAELRARLEELQASRARIVEAGDAERRRVERDLHDGAQQRLLSLVLSIQSAEQQLDPDADAVRLLGEARQELGRTVEELRDIAQGIHPAVLIDHGLDVALRSVVARSAVPTELAVALAERPPLGVEVAGFYLVTEALANVAKHSEAARVIVDIRREGDAVTIEVRDDGRGGAELGSGSGLLGLSDRVGALNGRLEVVSPAGGGTTIKAVIPCG